VNHHCYKYVGPNEIKVASLQQAKRFRIQSVSSLTSCIQSLSLSGRSNNPLVCTFTIDTHGELWLADRRSEHVACAGGENVLAAGEITFYQVGNGFEVTEVTNQSTGYCPQPSSWSVVAGVLDRMKIQRPLEFTTSFEFRRCEQCASINLIKESLYSCDVCGEKLSFSWNF